MNDSRTGPLSAFRPGSRARAACRAMDPYGLIAEFYPPGTRCHRILVRHGEQVAEKALAVAERFPAGAIDTAFVAEAALLHDIGIFLTHAPGIGCTGSYPYICHGYLGREILDRKGLHRHALVCERHVGVGISPADIAAQGLPLPLREMRPVTLEEEIIAYADKFYSKGSGEEEKTVPEILQRLAGFGADKAAVFRSWVHRFEGYDAADPALRNPIGP